MVLLVYSASYLVLFMSCDWLIDYCLVILVPIIFPNFMMLEIKEIVYFSFLFLPVLVFGIYPDVIRVILI